MAIAGTVLALGRAGPYFVGFGCERLAEFYNSTTELLAKYPACEAPLAYTLVKASAESREGTAAVMWLTFGPSLWVSLAIHVFCVETYVRPGWCLICCLCV